MRLSIFSVLLLVLLAACVRAEDDNWVDTEPEEEESVEDGSAPMYRDYTDDDIWDEDTKGKKRKKNMPQSIEIFTPFNDEIFSGEEFYISFKVHNMTIPDEGYAVVFINGGEVSTATTNDVFLTFPKMGRGVYSLEIRLASLDFKPIGVDEEVFFEIVNFAPPEMISPDPPNTYARMTNESQPPLDVAYHLYTDKVQAHLFAHQNPSDCGSRFLIWESWGIVGFGAQILGLRVALALGLETQRVVVGNPNHEAHLVKSEMKWRFGKSGELNAPWGEGLMHISPCTRFTDVMDSVRPTEFDDMRGDDRNVLVSGDIWGLANREHIFTMPAALMAILPAGPPPNIFWWWTEVMGYLMRPGPALADFIAQQKARMGWQRPIISIHMRLGIDKNREAQRFPTSYYMREARRIKEQFGIKRVFVCSDRPGALAKLVRKYGDEFEILVQPDVPDVISPMYTLLTDLLLTAEADFPIFTFSSNFGQAVFLLNSFYNKHRPSYISMDDNYEGFKYYGWQLKLYRNPATGVNEIMLIDCVKDKCTTQEEEMASGDHRVIGFDYVDKTTRNIVHNEL